MNRLRSYLWIAGLCFVSVVVWGWRSGVTSVEEAKRPIGYGGDGFHILTFIKSASEGHCNIWLGNNPRLGLPSGSGLSDFPQYHVPLLWLAGVIASHSNLFLALRVLALLSVITSALGFYAAGRLMRYSRPICATAALIWAFSTNHGMRDTGHVLLSFDYLIPLAIVISWWILGMRRPLSMRQLWVICAVAFLFGMGDIYSLVMWVVLLVVCFLYRERTTCIMVLGITFASAAFWHAPQWWKGVNKHVIPITYAQSELYALKPIALLMPPPSSKILGQILQTMPERYGKESWVKGELFSPYLGLVGIAGLLWLSARYISRRSR